MKKNHLFLLLFSSAMILSNGLSLAQKNPRTVQNFDFDWKFHLGDTTNLSARDVNDSSWEKIQLPHDWSINTELVKPAPKQKNLGSMGFMQGGIGWYRKTFSIPFPVADKKIFIHFDGVYHRSDVYINGRHVGFHPYGYTGFEYDITRFLLPGQNVVSVKVDHSDYPSSRWYSGSGIYRHVWLITTSELYVPSWGTSITTPEVTDDHAMISVITTITNRSATDSNVEIENRVLNSRGDEITSTSKYFKIGPNTSVRPQQILSIDHPMLWSIEYPNLYKMETTIKSEGRVTDCFSTTFGIRTFRFDADKGFFLNGINIKLKGMNLHQDAGSLGTAVPDMSYLRRLRILKEYGCNAIRCSHNPPSPEFLDICDSLGFVVIDEAFDKWRSGYYAKYFDEWWKRDIDAMVLRDINHPSIIMWSTGNETNEQNMPEGAATAKMLQDYVHSLDPTRPVTTVISPSNVLQRPYNENGFTEALDIVGYNYQEPWLVEDKKRFPERKMFIAEAFPYYTGRHNSLRDYNPKNPWYVVQNNDFVAGQFIWAGVDYLGESSGWPSTGWPTGLFDVCMFEKPSAAFHRSVWNKTPMIRIAVADQSLDIDPGKDHWSQPNLAEHWNFPQYKGHVIEVQTITNCDSAELIMNGAPMGKRARADYPNNTIVWHVPYKEGKIEAIGFNDSEKVAGYELKTTGKPIGFLLIPDRQDIAADGQDLVHVTIRLIDENNLVVPDADQLFTVEISGSGILKGLDNGDLRREGSYECSSIKTYLGRGLATIQSTRDKGEILIKLKSDDLPEAELHIKAK